MSLLFLLAVLASFETSREPPPATADDKSIAATDRPVMAEVAAALASGSPDLAALDAALAKLSRPTPLRAMVQTYRAVALAAVERNSEATAAVEEAMRILPDSAVPKLAAAQIFTFTGAPQRAADLWLLASRIDAALAQQSDRYYMQALDTLLREQGDFARADRLGARLIEIGYNSGLPNERSANAAGQLRAAFAEGRSEDGALAITAISNPRDLIGLYIDNRYRTLWPRIAEWAGADLEPQMQRYLEELRGAWIATDDVLSAVPYARQLNELREYDAAIALFLPLLERAWRDGPPEGIELLTPVIARSLAMRGRGPEAAALLDRIGSRLPADFGPNALNIDGAQVTVAAEASDWTATARHADAFLQRAQSIGGVNAAALIQVQAYRACALTRLERPGDAAADAATVLVYSRTALPSALLLFACQGDLAAARNLVVTQLSDIGTREQALRFVQPVRAFEDTPLSKLTNPFYQAVRDAPDVRAAAQKVGRIWPAPLTPGLPTGFDPYRARPGHRAGDV